MGFLLGQQFTCVLTLTVNHLFSYYLFFKKQRMSTQEIILPVKKYVNPPGLVGFLHKMVIKCVYFQVPTIDILLQLI